MYIYILIHVLIEIIKHKIVVLYSLQPYTYTCILLIVIHARLSTFYQNHTHPYYVLLQDTKVITLRPLSITYTPIIRVPSYDTLTHNFKLGYKYLLSPLNAFIICTYTLQLTPIKMCVYIMYFSIIQYVSVIDQTSAYICTYLYMYIYYLLL